MENEAKKLVACAVEAHKSMMDELLDSGVEIIAQMAEVIGSALAGGHTIFLCVLSCIANDYSYDTVFSRQVEALVRQGDVLWAFSTSGTSPNVVKAAQAAKEKDAAVLAFTGRPDSTLERIADVCLCTEHEMTARSQEVHQLAYHVICELVERRFCETATD